MSLKSPNAPLVLNSWVTLPGGGGSWVALRGGRGESVGVEDPLAPELGLTGLEGGLPGVPWQAPPWREGRAALTLCCCLLLTATAAADAALCRSSAACPGLSRLRVNLRVRSPAMAGRAARASAPERVCPAGPRAAPACSTHPPFRKRNSEPFPPSSPLNSQEAGFSRAHPHSAHPLCSGSSSAATLQTLPSSAANSPQLRRICSGSRGARVGWLHPRRPPGTGY